MKYDFECQVEVPDMKPYRIELPWPPSVNHYWRHVGARTLISKAGREYRQSVELAVLIAGGRRNLLGRLSLRIAASPPDLRRRDLDNVLKAPLDALAKCGVYEDDSQIDELIVRRLKPSKPGRLVIEIMELCEDRVSIVENTQSEFVLPKCQYCGKETMSMGITCYSCSQGK